MRFELALYLNDLQFFRQHSAIDSHCLISTVASLSSRPTSTVSMHKVAPQASFRSRQ
uniref:Uncharacterized protein n=1 Tax=Myoviridae sp. ctbWL16 TaxID=2826668 RepID=A0A8S5MRY9_9CAUD|nr:MAG TPA: hypothetical protein [Myoviridae sp. ctbWL16]